MRGEQVELSRAEARGVMLAAQALFDPPPGAPGLDEVVATIERLGAVQLDAINVVARSPYLVLWSRLGAYDPAALDQALYPARRIFEYWSHAASIVPMREYPYYRRRMLRHATHSDSGRAAGWLAEHPEVKQQVLDQIRQQGPLASADFERPADGRKTHPWSWYGPKESRRALEYLWTVGELMVHSRRGGQKRYDLRERVLAEACGGAAPGDDDLPSPEETLQHFLRRTIRALGVVVPSWLPDYFRLPVGRAPAAQRRTALLALLEAWQRADELVPARIEGLPEPAWVDRARLPDLERLKAGEDPARTALLSPFDSLIWHRPRTRALFDYEVCFEAYVVPEKRRYGYYCLAILHRGRLVGRLDSKLERAAGRLWVRAVYLEPEVMPDEMLLNGLAGSLRDLARFLGVDEVAVERSEPEEVAPALRERLG